MMLAAGLLAWEWGVVSGQVSALFFPAPTTIMDCVYNGLVIRKGLFSDPNSEITKEKLENLNFSTTALSPSGYFLDKLLEKYGLSLDDINLVDLLGSATVLAALQENTVDIAHFAEPWITRARAAEVAEVWLSQTSITPNVQSGVIVFGPTLLKDHPDVGVRFMVAYLQGVRQYAVGKSERNLEILEKHLELDSSLLQEACFPRIPTDGVIFTQNIEAFSQWAAEREYIDRGITADEFWTPYFVEQANQILNQL